MRAAQLTKRYHPQSCREGRKLRAHAAPEQGRKSIFGIECPPPVAEIHVGLKGKRRQVMAAPVYAVGVSAVVHNLLGASADKILSHHSRGNVESASWIVAGIDFKQ